MGRAGRGVTRVRACDERGVRKRAHDLRGADLRGGAVGRWVEHDHAHAEVVRREREHAAELAASEDPEGLPDRHRRWRLHGFSESDFFRHCFGRHLTPFLCESLLAKTSIYKSGKARDHSCCSG